MSTVVLLTGATGFLGTQIARRLIQKADCTVIALVRAGDREAARHRLARAWWDWRELADAIGTRVQVECGDVTAPRLGLIPRPMMLWCTRSRTSFTAQPTSE